VYYQQLPPPPSLLLLLLLLQFLCQEGLLLLLLLLLLLQTPLHRHYCLTWTAAAASGHCCSIVIWSCSKLVMQGTTQRACTMQKTHVLAMRQPVMHCLEKLGVHSIMPRPDYAASLLWYM
jgi:hypothetical protein